MDRPEFLTTELRLLTYTAVICLLIWIPYILCEIKVRGLSRAVGYPSGVVGDLPPWAQRAHRAHMNLVENIGPFAILVLVAHVLGISNEMTVLGARLFFWARLVQIAVMIAGISWVRTLAFAVGLIGNLLIFLQITIH
jgi:uncharacterized MAPEG superfamily protein